ncbi:MAG: VOC family protein [Leptolyngbya sp. SIO1D8]|nr:VOC family protein [Leptolyngbya sp. SIO1D8]
MSIKMEIGQVVWHDLLTHDVARAKDFYAELLGWQYQIEHAVNFVWKPGEADYPLILANGEAHGGFVDSGQDMPARWVAYVRVEAVDAVTAKAKMLGATVEWEPFDTPGVGRSAVLWDPQGAVICPHVPTHSFPPPAGTFLWDELMTADVEAATRFYRELFPWQINGVDRKQRGRYTLFKGADDSDMAGAVKSMVSAAIWVPYLATNNLDLTIAKATAIGATVSIEKSHSAHLGQFAVLADPMGAVFGLVAASEFPS